MKDVLRRALASLPPADRARCGMREGIDVAEMDATLWFVCCAVREPGPTHLAAVAYTWILESTQPGLQERIEP